MSVATRSIPAGGDYAYLTGVTWGFYEAVLREIGDRPVRVTYDRGRIEIMSPLPRHEKASRLLCLLIFALAEELDVPISAFGSTTFRKEEAGRGLEPDECFYIQMVDKAMMTDKVDLSVDPPPDLAIEVDVTHRSIKREPIYADLQIPELWRHDGIALNGYVLGEDRQYHLVERSRAFPVLRVAEMNQFLNMYPGTGDSQIIKTFRKWVRETLIKS